MKIIKLLSLVLVSFLLPIFSAVAWWPTGHFLSANIASEKLTEKTKTAVAGLLENKIEEPGPVTCTDAVPGHFLTAVATWADNLKEKTAKWTPETSQDFYNKTHFLDSAICCQPDQYKNPYTPLECVNRAIVYSKNDNAVSLLTAAINTLKSPDTSKEEKAFALRYFIHVAGDLTQPFHATEPIYFIAPFLPISTKGATKVKFKDSMSVHFCDPWERLKFSFNDVHSLWNYMGGGFLEYPYFSGDVNIGVAQQEEFDQQCYILIAELKHNEIIDFSKLNDELNSNADPKEWAVDTYLQTRDYGLKGLDFSDAHYDFEDKSITIPDPSPDYIKLAQELSKIQVYKAGIRIANMLNALFDPEHAPEAYRNFIDKLTGKTLDQLCHVNIKF